MRVTLAVEGATPLRVEVPEEVLDEQSAAVWRSRPAGPASLTDVAGGRQRWERTYRLDPYLKGNLPLGFAPAKAFAGTDPQPKEVTWPPLQVMVTSEVTAATEPRPPTGIEELPPAGEPPTSLQERIAITAALAGIACAGVVVVGLLRRRRRQPPFTPEEIATARLNELSPADPAFADRLSDLLREYVETRTPAAATKLTTAELQAELEQSGEWLAEWVAELIVVLEQCDRVKFAGQPLAPDGRDRLLSAARASVSIKRTGA